EARPRWNLDPSLRFLEPWQEPYNVLASPRIPSTAHTSLLLHARKRGMEGGEPDLQRVHRLVASMFSEDEYTGCRTICRTIKKQIHCTVLGRFCTDYPQRERDGYARGRRCAAGRVAPSKVTPFKGWGLIHARAPVIGCR